MKKCYKLAHDFSNFIWGDNCELIKILAQDFSSKELSQRMTDWGCKHCFGAVDLYHLHMPSLKPWPMVNICSVTHYLHTENSKHAAVHIIWSDRAMHPLRFNKQMCMCIYILPFHLVCKQTEKRILHLVLSYSLFTSIY